jgi:hypothetical protein
VSPEIWIGTSVREHLRLSPVVAEIRAFLHVEAVSRFDLPALAAIPEQIATIARCLKCDWLCAIELRLIPVHLSERKDLACEEALRLFGVL